MQRITAALLTVTATLLLIATGCETMKGVGKDITDASTSVQQTLFE